jgi:protein phosphatase PTC7
MPGDIVLLATDGLFDNVDLEEIVEFVSQWEKEQFVSKGQDLREPSTGGQASIDLLAKRLVERAREVSLDKMRDSPCALLAKENDIMWGGGMPDDTTVIVARIFKSPS